MNKLQMSRPRVVLLGAAVALALGFVWYGHSSGAQAADKDKKGDGPKAIVVETGSGRAQRCADLPRGLGHGAGVLHGHRDGAC